MNSSVTPKIKTQCLVCMYIIYKFYLAFMGARKPRYGEVCRGVIACQPALVHCKCRMEYYTTVLDVSQVLHVRPKN